MAALKDDRMVTRRLRLCIAFRKASMLLIILPTARRGEEMDKLIDQAVKLYELENCVFTQNAGHKGGRNRIVVVSRGGEYRFILRISALSDRTEDDLLAETEFVHFLAKNGAPVSDVIPSVNGRSVERIEADGHSEFVSLFAYAKGMLISDNGYRYRDGAPLEEYFFNSEH